MKLITMEAALSASNLDAATSVFNELSTTVLSMAGCKHYAIYHKPEGDGIAILQQWDTMEEFDAYRTSDTFAQLGKGLRPLMTAPPVTSVAEADIS